MIIELYSCSKVSSLLLCNRPYKDHVLGESRYIFPLIKTKQKNKEQNATKCPQCTITSYIMFCVHGWLSSLLWTRLVSRDYIVLVPGRSLAGTIRSLETIVAVRGRSLAA